MIFILSVIIFGVLPELNEEIIMKKFPTIIECEQERERIEGNLITRFPDENFEVVCYRSPTEQA